MQNNAYNKSLHSDLKTQLQESEGAVNSLSGAKLS